MKNISDDNIGRIIREEFENAFMDNFVLIGEDDTCLPKRYLNFAESIKNFQMRNSDVIVCGYPKTGSTWTQEMVWLIMNELDYEGAKSEIRKRFPFLEISALIDFANQNYSIEYVRTLKESRFIKTHLPFSLLPQQLQNGSKVPKIIYVTRNPKDVCVSYFHHGKLLHGWRANFEHFAQVFMAEKVLYGSYWKHVLGFWHQRSLPNLLIITYEDMKKDLRSVVEKVARFLDKTFTEEQMNRFCEHLRFESMKDNKAVNYQENIELIKKKNPTMGDVKFMRSGVVGKYKEEMSPEIIEKFDAWIEQNTEARNFVTEQNYNCI